MSWCAARLSGPTSDAPRSETINRRHPSLTPLYEAAKPSVAVGFSNMDTRESRVPYVWRWIGMAVAIVAIIYLFH